MTLARKPEKPGFWKSPYVIEDNYPKLAAESVELRKLAMGTGQLVGGLIRSTESRKSKLANLLSPIFTLLSLG
jgi:hypothetical protein